MDHRIKCASCHHWGTVAIDGVWYCEDHAEFPVLSGELDSQEESNG